MSVDRAFVEVLERPPRGRQYRYGSRDSLYDAMRMSYGERGVHICNEASVSFKPCCLAI
jgi:hypothetical protein